MRKLSLDRVYGCSTHHRHGVIGLPQNRVAFIAGAYLVVLDCSSNEQRYLSFCAIEFLYLSPRGTWMGIIDRLGKEGETRLHIYSTQPIDLLLTIDSDRFGNFLSVTMNSDETMLMILHGQPGYMLTIRNQCSCTEGRRVFLSIRSRRHACRVGRTSRIQYDRSYICASRAWTRHESHD
jgi:hypothetical protein